MKALQAKLKSPAQTERKSRGTGDPPIPTCTAERANVDTAAAAFEVALTGLQFATEELIRCESGGQQMSLSSEQAAVVGLMGSLGTFLLE